jgi:Raf kinase inhibitor-like YbhB/YbcL family protein
MERTETQASNKAIVASRLGLDAPTILIESDSFAPGGAIPRRHAGEQGRSPPLRWTAPPEETRELALICEDPDAPTPQPFVHWIVVGLTPDMQRLPEGLPPSAAPLASGVAQGKNDMGKDGYYGPEPPPGHGVHHYHFQIFAVDRPISKGARLDREGLVRELQDHVVAWGELVGTYQR